MPYYLMVLVLIFNEFLTLRLVIVLSNLEYYFKHDCLTSTVVMWQLHCFHCLFVSTHVFSVELGIGGIVSVGKF